MAKEPSQVKSPSQGDKDWAREQANRQARKDAAKSQPSIITHAPARS